MSYPVYGEYKTSSIEWLGDVPKHWEVLSIKRLTPVQRGASPRPIEDPKYFDDDGEYAWVRIADVTSNDHYLTDSTQRLSDLGKSLSVPLEPGTLFLSIAGSVGKPMITAIKACIHDGFVHFPHLQINPEFLYYIFDSGQPYLGLGKLGTQLNLNTDTVGGIKIGLPPKEEQDAIATFLDWKTGQIDALIDKKKELLGKLKEKRLAVITQAVTKGLDPTVAMRDSGIPWLGDVPKHWEVLPIKHLLTAILDTEHKTCPYYDDGEFLVARTPNIRDGKLTLDGAKYTDAAGYQEWTARGIPKPGDILFTREAPAGEACIVPDEPQLCIGQRVVLFRTDPQILESRYAIYSIYGGAARNFIEMHSLGSTVTHFNMSEIAMIPMLAPPIDEQISIAEYLDKQASKIDQMMSKVESAIARLTEYRSALITAATTGKIDVRDWQNPARKGKRVSLSLAPS